MISLLIALLVLIVGYYIYSRFAEKVFSPDERQTPAYAQKDGVDYVPMKPWKSFLIQLLNIAGTGPIFGALMGAVFGPIVFIWIVFGSILGGAVHDYMSGMISSRNSGASIAEISGTYMGKGIKWIMRVFSVVLLVLCGVVFVTSPAALLDKLVPVSWMNGTFWAIIILIYYLIATLLPIDKVIGKLYPVFGILLITMAIAVIGGILFSGGKYTIPEISLSNLHPEGTPVWPYMFITVACGAVSGFHATQSPMVAKCIRTEREGRKIFYGAMISEAVIALVWAAAGVAFYGTTQLLNDALKGGASNVVYEIATGTLGTVGAVLAVAGVIICPITSGDTAFRSARLIIGETFRMPQKSIKNRLIITLPLLAIGGLLTWFAISNANGFQIIWRYFSWSNQTLAMIALWVASAYLLKQSAYRLGSLLTAIPAVFMTAVTVTYIFMADEGFRVSAIPSYAVGGSVALVLFGVYLFFLVKWRIKGHIYPAEPADLADDGLLTVAAE
jgi:carbon starvation protein CstA